METKNKPKVYYLLQDYDLQELQIESIIEADGRIEITLEKI